MASVRAEIEQEREWRESELRFLKNHISLVRSRRERSVARKALVVMLYAHFEGVTKAILTIYVNALNGLGIPLAQVNFALTACALADVFMALRNPHSKCKVFARQLPDDAKLHRYARDREFLERSAEFATRPLTIDPDSVVDTESNLKPVVLRKILYRLGFDPTLIDPWEGSVHILLKRRNDVAHGTAREGLNRESYNALEDAVRKVVDALVAATTGALSRQLFLISSGGERGTT